MQNTRKLSQDRVRSTKGCVSPRAEMAKLKICIRTTEAKIMRSRRLIKKLGHHPREERHRQN